MLLKVFFLSVIVSFCNILFAAEVCKTEGETVGVYPGAPSCCAGLEAQSPPGLYGSATCVKRKSCVEEGGSVGVYPGAPSCCDGLEAQSPPGLYGSATCVKFQSPPASNINDTRRDQKPRINFENSIDSSSSHSISK